MTDKTARPQYDEPFARIREPDNVRPRTRSSAPVEAFADVLATARRTETTVLLIGHGGDDVVEDDEPRTWEVDGRTFVDEEPTTPLTAPGGRSR